MLLLKIVRGIASPNIRRMATLALLHTVLLAPPGYAQGDPTAPPSESNMSEPAASVRALADEARDEQAATPNANVKQSSTTTVTCAAKMGARQECAADTSMGIVLARSYGDAACL